MALPSVKGRDLQRVDRIGASNCKNMQELDFQPVCILSSEGAEGMETTAMQGSFAAEGSALTPFEVQSKWTAVPDFVTLTAVFQI